MAKSQRRHVSDLRSPVRRTNRTQGWWIALILTAVSAGVLGVTQWRPSGRSHQPPSDDKEVPRPHGLAAGDAAGRAINGPSSPETVVTIESAKDEAAEVARRLVECFPGAPEAMFVLAEERTLSGKSDEAMACWEKCLKLNARSAEAYFGMGCIASKKGDGEAAEAFTRQALAIDPTYGEAARFLGSALMDQGRMEEALVVLERNAQYEPRSATNCFLLGQTCLQLRRFDEAKRHLERAVEFAPRHTQAYYGLSVACTRLGQTEKAREYQEKFSSLKAMDQAIAREDLRRREDLATVRRSVASIYLKAGKVYQSHGEHSEAERHLLQAVWHDPEDTACRAALAQLYQQEDRLDEAVRILEELRKADPQNAAYHLAAGGLYVRLNRFEAAEEAFRNAYRLTPEAVQSRVSLAHLYLRTGRKLPEALTLARSAVEMMPTAVNYVLLAAACEKNTDFAGAAAAMEQAIQREPNNPEYRRMYEQLKAKQ